ncbi:uncharacterized protein LOC132264124 [Phlebotomus argentipes]|uniref:uncharacterized protein LOC132264124 n=1 Tax=Phlebotomus argentipes TaxID=94469 RepID=UPI002892DE41|nr:uncharacterized protein LOC132264124 [Phlebotomus argentipes]
MKVEMMENMECEGGKLAEMRGFETDKQRDNSLNGELSISFPEHRAVVFPKNQSFSFICNADSEEEADVIFLHSSVASTDQSDVISDQDIRFQNEMIAAGSQVIAPEMSPTEIVDDSCVAVFHAISGEAQEPKAEELTFNGKIPQQTTSILINVDDSMNDTSTTVLDSSQASLQIDLTESVNLNDSQCADEADDCDARSPDILGFDSDDEAVINTTDEKSGCELSFLNQSTDEDTPSRRERMMLKRLQNALAGVLPPPSITKSYLSVETILSIFEKNAAESSGKCQEINRLSETVMKPLNTVQEAIESSWPHARNVFTHGMHYNRSKYSEKIESLTVKYAERFIGAETSSSFVKLNSPSSSKKRYLRQKTLNQSPGRRLSHLAKRKAMFSCANLQKTSFSSSQQRLSQASSSRQIMLDPRGSKRSRLSRVKTPKRCLPAQRKTPKSKQKEKVEVKPALTRETSKRALFQSPPRQEDVRPAVTPEVAQRVDRSRRALFSSPKISRYSSFSQHSSSSVSNLSQGASLSNLTIAALANRENMAEEFNGKRKRGPLEDDDEGTRKLARLDGSFGRSQSFTAEYVARQNAMLATKSSLCKTTSDVCLSGRTSSSHAYLTDLEKQKLLYIVSQTLQRKQISGQHDHFKEYATVMAKAVKRLFLETNRKTFGSVSEQMSKIANNILFDVLQGKTVEEIYASERRKKELMRSYLRPNGYVSLESYRSGMHRSSSSLLSENSSQSTSLRFSQSENASQGTQGSFFCGMIDTGSILRENVDSGERQRSAQKGLFSGKDQKNVSPHISSHKKQKLVGGKNLTNLLKAKRQISFDT